VRPVARPSRDLFHQAVHHDAAEPQRPTPQRDEEVMRSLRSPFDEDKSARSARLVDSGDGRPAQNNSSATP
jgi:hypothetical protein